jgi:hypothetical protein
MILAVVGSKDFHNYSLMSDVLNSRVNVTMIVSGAAPGTDTLARKYARSRGLRFEEFPPDKTSFGKEAKHVRDRMIVQCCDHLIAFWDGICEGTEFTVNYAEELEKPVEIIRI